LSDFSPRMVEITREKYAAYPAVRVEQIDIQAIPYPDASFDRVIANHMLYHVPDLQKAISEVRRVLKPGGVFYAATNGNGGMRAYLHDALTRFKNIDAFSTPYTFALQNGGEVLSPFFDDVRLAAFEDSLRITETQDLVDWILSTVSVSSAYTKDDLEGLFDFFEAVRQKEGKINIPKETGMFIARKLA